MSNEKHIGTVIILTSFEQAWARSLTNRRSKVNLDNGITEKRVSQKETLIELEGTGGELAFCKLFNVYPDFSLITPSSKNGTDTGDAILNGNIRVDVKSTHYANGKLIVTPSKKDTPIDLFALMVGQFPRYEFKGFMTKEDLIKESRFNADKFNAYEADQNELYEIYY